MTQQLASGPLPPSGTRRHRAGWWRDAVIYQVYPRSFADGNGDGMGDLAGVRSRLPYLRDLGVDAVWLSPFYASPQADAGYDVADYRAVDPMFGNLLRRRRADRDAHGLGPAGHRRPRPQPLLRPARVVPARPWREGPGSPLRDALPLPARQGRRTANCRPTTGSRSSAAPPGPGRRPGRHPGEWYLHLFAPEQPDFNWEHPAVRRRVPLDPALLARHGRRRLPHRRRPRHGQGRRPARHRTAATS